MENIIVRGGGLDSEPQVSKDEWKQVLLDEDFMSNNYKFALITFYLEPEHKATCKYLAEKYNTLPESITEFCRAVQKRLNRVELIKENRAQSLWQIAMTVKKISHGLFELRLRQELIEAMKELDYFNGSKLYIDSIETLVEHINNDIGVFKREFAEARKMLASMGRTPNSNILFKYEKLTRDWAINEGAGTEVQLHIYLSESKIGYGLGFNTLYVRFKDKKTPIEYIKPYMDAFVALKDSEEITILANKGYLLNVDYSDFIEPIKDEHYLFGRTISLDNNTLPITEYYKILNDIKGDLFNAYKKVFETANKLCSTEEEISKMVIQNPLVKEICELLETNKNVILTGAPGTGKTYLAKEVIKTLDAESEFVQFHPSYDYTDFVEGLRPTQNDKGVVGFELRDGIFKAFCKEAVKYQKNQKLSNFDEVYQRFIDEVSENGLELVTPHHKKPFNITTNSKDSVVATPNTEKQTSMTVTKDYIQTYFETGKVIDWKPYLIPICEYIKANYELILPSIVNKDKKFVIILDEINRAEVSKVLGELFYSIDPGYRGETGRVKTQYANLQTEGDVFKSGFYVPDNVYIIGTMNDIDRSVESFDFAMRRRFAWKEIKAADRLSMWDGVIDPWIDESTRRLRALNTAIESVEGLNSAYHVGPAYFLKLASYEGDFKALWQHHLQSLLFEYVRGYPNADQQLTIMKTAYDRAAIDDSNDG